MLSNLTPIFYLRVITAKKQRQLNIYNAWKNARQVRYDYTVVNLLYVYNTGI